MKEKKDVIILVQGEDTFTDWAMFGVWTKLG